MSKNNKSKIVKSKKTPASPKKTLIAKMLNNNEFNEPFAFAKKIANNKIFKSNITNNAMKSAAVEDIKTITNNYTSLTSCTITCGLDAANSTTTLTEEVLSKTSALISNSLGKNVAIGQDLLKCKDVKDAINLQQKLFETNFASIIDFFSDISYITQSFAAKNIESTLIYLDENIDCSVPSYNR